MFVPTFYIVGNNTNCKAYKRPPRKDIKLELPIFGSAFIEGQPNWLFDPFKISVVRRQPLSYSTKLQHQWSNVRATILNFVNKTDIFPRFINLNYCFVLHTSKFDKLFYSWYYMLKIQLLIVLQKWKMFLHRIIIFGLSV